MSIPKTSTWNCSWLAECWNPAKKNLLTLASKPQRSYCAVPMWNRTMALWRRWSIRTFAQSTSLSLSIAQDCSSRTPPPPGGPASQASHDLLPSSQLAAALRTPRGGEVHWNNAVGTAKLGWAENIFRKKRTKTGAKYLSKCRDFF